MAIKQGRLVIEISGGNIQSIKSDRHLQVIIKDLDNEEDDEERGERGVVEFKPEIVEETFNNYYYTTET